MKISSFNINKFCGTYSSPLGGYYNPKNIDFKIQIKNIVDSLLNDNNDIIFLQEFVNNKYIDVLNVFKEEKYTIFSNNNYISKSNVVAITLKDSIWEKEDCTNDKDYVNKIIKMKTKNLKIISFHNTDDNIKRAINNYFEKNEYDIIIGDFNNTEWIRKLNSEPKIKYRDLVSDEMITFKPAQTAIDRIFIKKVIDSNFIVFNGIIDTFSSDHNILSFSLNYNNLK